jgi:membrane associated rhomboid family serine protease
MGELMDEQAPGEDPSAPAERRREPVFNLPRVVAALIAACVIVHLFRLYVLSPVQDQDFILRFAFIPLRYSGDYVIDIYAIVSPLTYAFLHGGWLHLGINMIWLGAFGAPLAGRIGPWRFLLFWAATSLAAVFLHYIFNPLDFSPVVGASGAISGMMGAAARFGFQIDRSQGKPAFSGPVLSIPQVLRSRAAVVFVLVWMAVNVVTGLGFGMPSDMGRIAWQAHIGGFLAGFFGIFLFVPPAPPEPREAEEPPELPQSQA